MKKLIPALVLLLAGTAALAQQSTGITLPPSGDNQRSTVTQAIGLVKVTIDYSSPRVVRNGDDRRGKIYGKLVPYGMQKGLGYGNCTECPWRAGANENTTFTTTNDIKVEGQPLPAGTYGLHMIPGESEWTIIFSKNSTSWGSFWYDPADDALRVKVKPAKSEYHEFLTYEFPDRQFDKAVAALKWEELSVPFTITVDNPNELYLTKLRNELKGAATSTENLVAAAQFALTKSPKDALTWAQLATNVNFGGRQDFNTLSILADAQEANGMTAESKKTREQALSSPTATVLDLHQYARTLLRQGKKDDALAIFQLNAKRHPNEWPVNLGLARAYSAQGKYQDAVKYAKLALAQAPDDANRKSIQTSIEKLEAGKDIN